MNGTTVDPRWVTIASTSARSVISDNPALENTLGRLPGYDLAQEEGISVNLLFRTFIEWRLQCEQESYATIKGIAEENNPVNTVLNVQLFYLIISFLALIVVGLITPVSITLKQMRVLLRKGFELEHDVIVSGGVRIVNPLFVFLKLAFLSASIMMITNFNRLASLVT